MLIRASLFPVLFCTVLMIAIDRRIFNMTIGFYYIINHAGGKPLIGASSIPSADYWSGLSADNPASRLADRYSAHQLCAAYRPVRHPGARYK